MNGLVRCQKLGARSNLAHHIADVLRAGLRLLRFALPAHHWKTLNALMACRTAKLGGHLYRCERCEREHFTAHGCRNRHCPNCQGARARDWLEKQTASLLPVPYFHLVFTLPHGLNALIAQNQRALYRLLFQAASATLLEFGRNRFGAQIGLTAVLHTWSQTLCAHYHLHCIVTSGGLSLDGQTWRDGKANYLFPVRALSKVFQAKYRDGLRELYNAGKLKFFGTLEPLAEKVEFNRLVRAVFRVKWVVYAKKPFGGPEQVLRYLSRYTHRVAISNGRILQLDSQDATVTFAYKDYRDRNRGKTMTLGLEEFIRRFCLHILPERFVKIRHYGLIGNHQREAKLAKARELIAAAEPVAGASDAADGIATVNPPPEKDRVQICPQCGSRGMTLIARYAKGSVPARFDFS